jgi:hypothetical protein
MVPAGHCIADISQEQYRYLLAVFFGQEIMRNMGGCPFSCMIRTSGKTEDDLSSPTTSTFFLLPDHHHQSPGENN